MRTPMPAKGPLIDWLRAEAKEPFEQPRGDVGDQVALQWLVPLVEQDSRLPFAIGELLREGDYLVCERLLKLATLAAAGPQLGSAVARVLAAVAPTLAQLQDGDRTLLRPAVEALSVTSSLAEPLPPDALATLRAIDRREDGWPLSLAIALIGDANAALDLVAPAAARMNDDDVRRFTFELVALADEPTQAATMRRIGQEASAAVCAHVGAGLQRQLAEFDEHRRQLVAMGLTPPPRESGADRWLRYAPALGLTP